MPWNEQHFLHLSRKAYRYTSFVLGEPPVEHVMQAVVNLAERIVVLDFGQVLAEGQPEVVMRNESVIEAYLGTGGAIDA